MSSCESESYDFILFDKTLFKLFTGLHESKLCIGEYPSNSPFLKNNGDEAHCF